LKDSGYLIFLKLVLVVLCGHLRNWHNPGSV
jgi:hypothetical protein